jgi:hypothetical protein
VPRLTPRPVRLRQQPPQQLGTPRQRPGEGLAHRFPAPAVAEQDGGDGRLVRVLDPGGPKAVQPTPAQGPDDGCSPATATDVVRLEAYALEAGVWQEIGRFAGPVRVSVPPFDAVTIHLQESRAKANAAAVLVGFPPAGSQPLKVLYLSRIWQPLRPAKRLHGQLSRFRCRLACVDLPALPSILPWPCFLDLKKI